MPTHPERILRRPEVEERVGLRRSAIYFLMTQGSFPRPVRLGPRAVGWRESAIEEWIEARPPTRGHGPAPTPGEAHGRPPAHR